MIFATSSLTDGGASWRPRICSLSSAASASVRRSSRTGALQQLVDCGRLQLVGDGVGDQARRALGDRLADHEVVLAQRRARGGEVDDRLDEAGQRRELDRALDLDDLGLATRRL